MSRLERYFLEDRLRVPFSRTIPSEPRRTGIGDNGDGMDSGLAYVTDKGEALLVPGVNVFEEEVDALRARGAIFPLEIAQPSRVSFMTEKEIFNARGETIGFDQVWAGESKNMPNE